MKKGYLEGKHSGVQFLVLLLWVFVSGIIALLLSISLGTTIWAKEFMLALMGEEQGSIFYYANLFLIFFQHLGFFILPAFLFVYGFHESWADFFQLKKRPSLWQWVLMFFLYIFVQYPLAWVYDLNQHIVLPSSLASLEEKLKSMEESAEFLFNFLAGYPGWEGWFFSFIVMAILPAFSEELFFRGTLQRWLQRFMNPWLAIFIASFVFSFIHFQFYGFFARFVLGFLLGYLYYRTKSLWATMFFHFINNGVAFILKRLYELGKTSLNPDDPTFFTSQPLLLIFMSILFVVTIYLFEKKSVTLE